MIEWIVIIIGCYGSVVVLFVLGLTLGQTGSFVGCLHSSIVFFFQLPHLAPDPSIWCPIRTCSSPAMMVFSFSFSSRFLATEVLAPSLPDYFFELGSPKGR